MLDGSIRVLNFDDSVAAQKKLLGAYRSEVIDLKDIAPEVRFWMSGNSMEKVAGRIRASAKSSVTFLGSGDFHHVSNILINAVEGPLTVINFDLHPDWNTFPKGLGCGSWVTETLKNSNVAKFILIGISSAKALSFTVQAGNYDALEKDRVEVYPWSQCPSLAFLRKVPPNISVRSEKRGLITKIHWSELKGRDLTEFMTGLFERLPTKQVYLSIDKDCLQKQYSLTNWQEGQISISDLFLMLKLIRERLDIVGADITGDYSAILVKGALKKLVSHINHPKTYSAKGLPCSHITGMNEETNLKLMDILTGC